MVMEWLLLDYSKNDIATQCIQRFKISERQALRYIDSAYETLHEATLKDFNKNVSMHVQRRLKLIRTMDESLRKTPAGIRAILQILKDTAALQGLYKADNNQKSVKIKVTTK